MIVAKVTVKGHTSVDESEFSPEGNGRFHCQSLWAEINYRMRTENLAQKRRKEKLLFPERPGVILV